MAFPLILDHAYKTVHPETVRKVLRSNGFKGGVPRRKPLISEQNRKKRLDFAKQHIEKNFTFWETVLFTNENSHKIFRSTRMAVVWRKDEQREES